MNVRLPNAFFQRDVLEVAPEMLGKIIVRRFENQIIRRFKITEVEAYSGDGDLACHASKGKTPRTEVMFREGGLVYVYLIYGMYWMLNVVSSVENEPQAVLIRSLMDVSGPGRLSRSLSLDKSFNGEHLASSKRIWMEEAIIDPAYSCHPRIGIDYAGDYWKGRPWRYVMDLNK